MLRRKASALLHGLCAVFYFIATNKVKFLPYDYIKMWLCV